MNKKNINKILIVCSILIIAINAIAKDKKLLKTTLIVYIFLLIYKISSLLHAFINHYNKKKTLKTNFLDFLKNKSVVFYNIVVQDSILLYYGFILWKEKNATENDKYFNSYYKNPNTIVYFAFIFIILLESCFVDFLLIRFSNKVLARFAIFSSAYILIVFIAHIKALKFRYTCFSNDNLIVRYGIMNEVVIPYSLIQLEDEKSEKTNIIPLGLLSKIEKSNITIHFKTPMFIPKIYGIKKNGNGISLYISDIENFRKSLWIKLNSF